MHLLKVKTSVIEDIDMLLLFLSCLVDGRSDSSSAFLSPRVKANSLQFTIEAFRFTRDPRDLVRRFTLQPSLNGSTVILCNVRCRYYAAVGGRNSREELLTLCLTRGKVPLAPTWLTQFVSLFLDLYDLPLESCCS